MQERILNEVEILTKAYPDLEYVPEGQWVKTSNYPLPAGWNKDSTDVVFQIPPGYPGAHPYGIYVPTGLCYQDKQPQNYTTPAKNNIPFKGSWGMFSWQPENWKPADKITAGSNLWTWMRSFSLRFKEGA